MCLCPNYIFQWFDDSTGERKTQFLTSQDRFNYSWKLKGVDISDFVPIPCGSCAECLEQYSNEWSWRVMCELADWKEQDCCFITLTYADNPISLNKDDLRNFIKRLRKKIAPDKLRYFACGEYGSKGLRPHYHLILFGYRPKDLKFFKRTKKHQVIYTSDELSNIWNQGFVSIGDVSSFSAKYCAKYMQKLNDLDSSCIAPFTSMSLKPGLGLNYFLNHKDEFLKADAIYFGGKYQHIPRYYLRHLEKDFNNNDDLFRIKSLRKKKADLLYNVDNSFKYERLKKL